MSLGKINDTQAVEPLIQALKDDYDQENAAKALVDIGKQAAEPLIQALRDDDNYVREKAAESLGKIKNTRALGPLIQALKDDDSIVRNNAVEALGKIKDTQARTINPASQ